MFHLELRQFPNTARAFNLSAEEVQRRFLEPWVAGRSVELDDRRWSPEKARLTIYEGPSLRFDEIGMGRGWGNVTRTGQDVSDRLIEAAQQASAPQARRESVEELKTTVLERAGAGISIPEVLALANERYSEWRASDRLAVAELAVWELLHQSRLRMALGGRPLENEEWGSVLLEWDTWAPGPDTVSPTLEPAD